MKIERIKIRKEYSKDVFDILLKDQNINTMEDLFHKACEILQLPNENNHCFDPEREEVHDLRDIDLFEDGSIFIITSDNDTISKYETEEAIKVREEDRCQPSFLNNNNINANENVIKNNNEIEKKEYINNNNNHNSNNNNYIIELEGKKPKRIGIWQWFVTIHEFYYDDENAKGDLRPGKRMCLTQKQWNQLKEAIPKIDQMLLNNKNTDHF